ncbi:acetylxylan esterase [Ginsengibacter hankyongi]|nr:acetylxylan esterase [Ginsengibacter hankyongi]
MKYYNRKIGLFVLPFTIISLISLNCSAQISAIPLNTEPKAFAISYVKPTEFDNPQLIKGLEIIDSDNRRFIQLKGGSNYGLAEDYFVQPTGKYNVSVYYMADSLEKSEVKVMINRRLAGSVVFGSNKFAGSSSHKTFARINIEKWSRIDLEFNKKGSGKCRIEKVIFTPTGAFDGKLKSLSEPKSLKLYQTSDERLFGRAMLSDFVNSRIDSLMAKRVNLLSTLKTPTEWQENQNKTRSQLEKFFGKFPERTPLHPHITGKIIHDKYTVERLYFQSQPGYYVTANLYIPTNRKGPLPAVLLTSGHSSPGKAYSRYQTASIGLALKGYIVLAIDPMGQGERFEYLDPKSKEITIQGPVDEHYYLGRPSFLVNWTLSGLRVWDCIRAVDYLVSRREVDTSKIAAVGNSGGGQMALLITAVDTRIKVCAAGHPGGQMEKNYLPGQNLIDRQIFSLIAPRPVRVIVGEKSGEAAFHRKKIEDIQLFNEGLGFDKNRAQIVIVDGVHDLKYPKREKVYEWLNHWFDKEVEGATEPAIQTEEPEALWATKSGLTLTSLGGETGQTLNAKRLKEIYKPASNIIELKERIAKRIGLSLNEKKAQLKTHSSGTYYYGDLSVEKLTYHSEEGVEIPSLLITPKNVKAESPVYIYASDRGKPTQFEDMDVPFQLAKRGYIVLAIDVRGIGETSPTPSLPLTVKYSDCTPFQWFHDRLAIESPGFGRTMLAMRTYDVMRGIDFVKSQKEFEGKRVVVYGKGLGGLWALLASIYDSRVNGVVTDGTLASYKLLITNKYYKVPSAYFWVPGAVCDFDIPDLARLTLKQQIWINPISGLGENLSSFNAVSIIGSNKNIHIVTSGKTSDALNDLKLFN